MKVCKAVFLNRNGKGPTNKPVSAKEKNEPILVNKSHLSKTFTSKEETIEVTSDCSDKFVFKDHPVCGNGFVSTIHKAFADELPVALAPSHIWTLILQAVSIHVNKNAEQLRDVFVAQEGQKTIIVDMPHLNGPGQNSAEGWSEAFPLFSEKLSGAVKDPKILSDMVELFADCGKTESICFTVAMMDTLKQYFKYRVRTTCGISSVHLLGEAADWISLRDRARRLCKKLSLDWWAAELIPVLDQFVSLALGCKENLTFWQHMYRDLSAQGSGEEYSGRGWINVFFPYKRKSPGQGFQRRCVDRANNAYFEAEKTMEKVGELLTTEKFYSDKHRAFGFLSSSKIAYTDYPAGVNKCPFEWKFPPHSYDMRFCAGFLSCIGRITLPTKEKACVPHLGWSVVRYQKDDSPPRTDRSWLLSQSQLKRNRESDDQKRHKKKARK